VRPCYGKSLGGAYQAGFLVLMSYEALVAVVVINAVMTVWLAVGLRRVNLTKANRSIPPHKKAAKLLWRTGPIVPRHDPPQIDLGRFKGNLFERAYRDFFVDFKDFADVVNWQLAGKYGANADVVYWREADKGVASCFRLQDVPNDDVGIIDRRSGPTPGRSFRVYCNHAPIGWLEIEPSMLDYTTEFPQVRTDVEINGPRLISYGALAKFLWTIADFVTDIDTRSESRIASRRIIETALAETLWNYEDMGTLVVRFGGRAERYVGHAVSRRELGPAAPSRQPLS
jgi:hypothetical protein